MIHYSIWFTFSEGPSEQGELARVRQFLSGLKQDGRIHDFTLLRNRGSAGKTRLGRLQATIEFVDQAQFDSAFKQVAEAGVHEGQHGLMIRNVDSFVVEEFDVLTEE